MAWRRSRWRALDGGAARPSVFEESLLTHLDSLYGLAMRLTKDADTAADLLQDTALRAFEKFRQLRRPEATRAWLAAILTRTFLNRYTSRAEPQHLTVDVEAVSEETPEAALLRRCDAADVEAALGELPDQFRLAVLLADVEELPLREIAGLCQCPLGTVASRLARGRHLLRERLWRLRSAREGRA